ncbi:hypothetical protein [Catenulispora yoronensis]
MVLTTPPTDGPTSGLAGSPTDSPANTPTNTPTSAVEPAVGSSAPAPTATTWVSGMPPGQNTLLTAAESIRPMLARDYADWFAAIAFQQPKSPDDKTEYALLVYRVPHPALDDAVRSALPTTKVVFVDTKLNLEQQRALTNSVSFGYWRDQGLTINTLGCDFDGVCTFGVDDPAKWRAALEAKYGKAKVVVIKQGQATSLTGDVAPGTTLASGPR